MRPENKIVRSMKPEYKFIYIIRSQIINILESLSTVLKVIEMSMYISTTGCFIY